MSRYLRAWPLVALLLSLLVFPDLAQAKRFKRYPGDVKQEQAKAPPRQPDQRAPDADAEGEGMEFEDYEPYEPEEPPGLLGYFLHGSDGLTVEYIYTGDVFNNARGGVRTRNATEYLGLFDLAITADLDEMGFRPGGTIFVLGEDFHGKSIGPYVGDFQGTDNIDSGRSNMQVSEFWWERGILDGLITFRLGKQDANADFGVVDLGGDFVHASFGMPPTIPMPAWPDQAMGVVTFFQLFEWASLDVGVFDGAADGRTWGFSGTGETFTIGQLKAEWALSGGRLPGDFHVGLWYHSGMPEDPGDPNVTFTGNHGYDIGIDQLIFKESWAEDDDQGLGVFFQYGWAPEERNEVSNYIGGGLVYKGLIPCRDDDITGLGVAQAVFSDRMAVPRDETAIELFHKIPLSPYFMIQPDLQYIAHPSGVERDAVVAGLRFEVVL